MAAILRSAGDRRREMSDNVSSVIFKSGLVENMGVEDEVVISNRSKVIAASVFPAAILDFR